MPADLNAATEDLGRRVRKVADERQRGGVRPTDDTTYRTRQDRRRDLSSRTPSRNDHE